MKEVFLRPLNLSLVEDFPYCIPDLGYGLPEAEKR